MNKQIHDFKYALEKIIPSIQQVAVQNENVKRYIDPNELDINDRSDRGKIMSILDDLVKLSLKIQMLNAEVVSEGTILKNDSGYFLNEKKLEIDDRIEILVFDEVEQLYTFEEVTLDYWDGGLYTVEYPSLQLEGVTARLRELASDK